MQVQALVIPTAGGTAALPGPVSVFTSIIRTSGIKGLWVGQSGTFTKEYVGSLLIARRLRSTCSDSQPSNIASAKLLPWESALSGACSGVTFNLAFYPADSVKSFMQTEDELRPKGVSAPKTRSTFLGTLMRMYRAKGIRGLYAGCGLTLSRSMVSSGMIFFIYDELDRAFG
jgi:mitochondrial ornithine carrier protein